LPDRVGDLRRLIADPCLSAIDQLVELAFTNEHLLVPCKDIPQSESDAAAGPWEIGPETVAASSGWVTAGGSLATGSPFCGAGRGPKGWISGKSLIVLFLGLRRGVRKLPSKLVNIRGESVSWKVQCAHPDSEIWTRSGGVRVGFRGIRPGLLRDANELCETSYSSNSCQRRQEMFGFGGGETRK
jgi:hypothetical protein